MFFFFFYIFDLFLTDFSQNGRVKMGDWNFLGGILEEVHIHSTMVGKIWLTILFIFRMLVLGVAAEDVWNDEQADFICNTEQPGCRNVCYDLAFPISLIRYWVLQVIFVSSPSLVYMGHALYRLRALEKARQRKKALLRKELELVDVESAEARKRIEREVKQLDQGKLNKAPLRGSLLRTYVAHVVTRSVVEVAFMTGQYILYGFHLYPLFKCERDPCPNAVDCYVSRPTEKSVFMVFMQCIAAISLFLNILEIAYLGYKWIKQGILDLYPHLQDELDDDFVNKGKKESVAQLCSSAGRKMTITFSPNDDIQLQGMMCPPAALPLLSELSTHPDPKCCSTIHPKLSLPHSQEKESSESGSPDHPKCPQNPACESTAPPQPVNAPRRPWRAHSFKCATVPEGKGSDTDSRDSAKSSGGQQCSQTPPKPRHHSCSSTAESLDGSSPGSVHSPTLSPSYCKSSITSKGSSRREPDLQI